MHGEPMSDQITNLSVSVVLCTHNPRMQYLNRTLDSLRAQSLPLSQWEMIVVDNASEASVAQQVSLVWHPRSRVLVEKQLGLTAARRAGIHASSGSILVFVDDDNLLANNYLERVVALFREYPTLGVCGGRIDPEFEDTPPMWTRPYWGLLAIREIEADSMGRLSDDPGILPCGAGMAIRGSVAFEYAGILDRDPDGLALDRRGEVLTSCGDTEIALVAHRSGFDTGVFRSLHVVHIIPASRLTEFYLLRLVKGMAYSETLLAARSSQPKRFKSLRFPWLARISYFLRFSRRRRKFALAMLEGRLAAIRGRSLS